MRSGAVFNPDAIPAAERGARRDDGYVAHLVHRAKRVGSDPELERIEDLKTAAYARAVVMPLHRSLRDAELHQAVSCREVERWRRS